MKNLYKNILSIGKSSIYQNLNKMEIEEMVKIHTKSGGINNGEKTENRT